MLSLLDGKQIATTPKIIKKLEEAHLTINEYFETFLKVFAPKNAAKQKTTDNTTPIKSKTKLFQLPR
jgi:hypothetical protein